MKLYSCFIRLETLKLIPTKDITDAETDCHDKLLIVHVEPYQFHNIINQSIDDQNNDHRRV